MDRSRRGGANKEARATTAPPNASRLTLRPKRNRRRRASLWERMPERREVPRIVVNACGRVLRRGLPAIVATAVICGVGASLWLGYRFVTTSERFEIAAIEVQGAARVSPDAVREALPARVGDNIFVTDLDDLTATVRNNPWVAAASAHRELPDTVVIEIREHVAAAVVQLRGEMYLVDEQGRPFKRAHLDEAANLPLVTGLTNAGDTGELVVRALGVLERWRANPLRPEISEIHVDAHHAITLRTYDRSVAIQLGAWRELDARLATFDAAWRELTDSEKLRVTALHLDARPDHVTVAFAPRVDTSKD